MKSFNELLKDNDIVRDEDGDEVWYGVDVNTVVLFKNDMVTLIEVVMEQDDIVTYVTVNDLCLGLQQIELDSPDDKVFRVFKEVSK